MEHGFFEDVFPIEIWYIHCYVSLLEGITWRCAKSLLTFTIHCEPAFWQHVMYHHVCKNSKLQASVDLFTIQQLFVFLFYFPSLQMCYIGVKCC